MWHFDSELSLETFVHAHLPVLLGLTPIARQFYLDFQVCDLLAVSPERQLVILELKNTEDRYVVQQLTRYYHAVVAYKPLAEQVDYDRPIRLVAIAPSFHAHNFIDRQYSTLPIEFLTFRVQPQAEQLEFCLTDIDHGLVSTIEIPSNFHSTLVNTALPVPVETERKLPPPPKSLRRLVENLAPTEQDYVMQLRQQILRFSDRMQEVGRTTSTDYGLRKGERDLYKTKMCARLEPFYTGSNLPFLLLQLPYPKIELSDTGRRFRSKPVKGLAWTQVSHQKRLWDTTAPIQIFTYLGKTRNYHSHAYNLVTYAEMYAKLTGQEREFRSISDLVTLALEEWKAVCSVE